VPHDGFGCGKIQELGVEVERIPGRFTGLCQPVDVGVNKPFKKIEFANNGNLGWTNKALCMEPQVLHQVKILPEVY
jgi:hypothetical protein